MSIKEVIFRVRTCCIDKIALAFNALTNHNPGLAASRQHHNKNIMIYNSKNTLKELCFVEYHFGAIYIKKASRLLFNPFFFVKLDDINSYKPQSFVTIKYD